MAVGTVSELRFRCLSVRGLKARALTVRNRGDHHRGVVARVLQFAGNEQRR